MRLVIFSDLHKTSVTKRDISMKVTKEYSGKRNITNEVIEEAQRRFRDIFGFEWKELPKTVVTRTGKMKTKSIGLFCFLFSFFSCLDVNFVFFKILARSLGSLYC